MKLLPILSFSLAFLSLSIFATPSKPVSHMTWKPLDFSQSITAAFGNSTHSFDVMDNWRICMTEAVFTIPYKSIIMDYSDIITSYLKAASQAGGGAVQLETGMYHISAPIEVPARTCLIGASMEGTIIKLIDGAEDFPDKGILNSRKGERVSIHSLTVDGNKVNQDRNYYWGHDGVYFELVNYAWFRNVRVQNMFGYGFDVHGSNNRGMAHVLFEGSVALDNQMDGFKIGQSYYASVANSLAKGNGRHGISVSNGAKHTLIKTNRLTNNGERVKGCGIKIAKLGGAKPNSVLLENTEIMNSFYSGICVDSGDNIMVKDCKVRNYLNHGSYCYDLDETTSFSLNGTTCDVISDIVYSPGTAESIISQLASGGGSSSLDGIDSTCLYGIREGDVCCPISCGTCGGDGCSSRQPNDACCLASIRSTRGSCAVSLPPCIIPNA